MRAARATSATSTDTVRDQLDRPLRDLRLSVTDRCNLRCRYCMPEQEYTWLPRGDILSFEEIGRLVEAFGSLGATKVRITGGEPLMRRGLADLIQRVAAQPSVRDLAMTTNGVGLAARARELRQAGLGRVTVSLDTLRAERFTALTQRDNHAEVLAGIAALAPAGFTGTKINAVVMRSFNDDELADLLELGAQVGAEVRFIEYMDVGGATEWAPGQVVGVGEILHRLGAHYGPIDRVAGRSSAPANRYRLPDGRVFGIVASTTEPFCATCDRSRVTADGLWYRCLYAHRGIDLRTPLRQGATVDDLRSILAGGWRSRRDQGAVERRAQPQRGSAVPVKLLRRDPHLEMHTRGG